MPSPPIFHLAPRSDDMSNVRTQPRHVPTPSMERWRTIPDFPSYEISDWGNIYNRRRRKMMRISYTQHGHAKITLTDEFGLRHDKSVGLLVANLFVRQPNHLCDHLMVLSGELADVRASNLAWRPRSFAWKYTHQLRTHQPINYKNLPVRNVFTGAEYSCVMEAGIEEGLLFEDIWRLLGTGDGVFPTGAVFEIC
jgi:hypothetical protein